MPPRAAFRFRVRGTVAGLVLAVAGALPTTLRAAPCGEGISQETTRHLFELVKESFPKDTHCKFEGVGAESRRLELRWSIDGKAGPPIRATLGDCASAGTSPTSFVLDVPPDFVTSCPAARPMLEKFGVALQREKPVGSPPPSRLYEPRVQRILAAIAAVLACILFRRGLWRALQLLARAARATREGSIRAARATRRGLGRASAAFVRALRAAGGGLVAVLHALARLARLAVQALVHGVRKSPDVARRVAATTVTTARAAQEGFSRSQQEAAESLRRPERRPRRVAFAFVITCVTVAAGVTFLEQGTRLVFGQVIPRVPSGNGAWEEFSAWDQLATKERLAAELGAPEILDYLLLQTMPLTGGSRQFVFPEEAQQSTDTRPAVLIVGDSVAEGAGVPEDEYYVNQLAKRLPGFRFVNVAQGGLNIYQVYADFRIYYPRVRPALVVYIGSDDDPLPRVWTTRGPETVPGLYRADPRTGFPRLWPIAAKLIRSPALMRWSFLKALVLYCDPSVMAFKKQWTRADLETFRKPFSLLVRDMARRCDHDGVPFVAVNYYNESVYDDNPLHQGKDFVRILQDSLGGDQLDVRGFDVTHFRDLVHLTGKGQTRLAEDLAGIAGRVKPASRP